ncbi:MAG: hypothetical protein IPP78_15615 [Holophagaceae bacterium]|nr:hypothetical protein [Holophagaceae bacterium]
MRLQRNPFQLLGIGAVLLLAGIASGCGSTGQTPPQTSASPPPVVEASVKIGNGNVGNYMVTAWNDLGMHCLNPTYDTAVILPPYNTVWAQVVQRGNPPHILTTGLTAQYRIINNTKSYGKGTYGQFWDNAKLLFGVALAKDKGLNLVDPFISNGLSGQMVNKGDHFEVDGIPVVPVDDSGKWNPYQQAEITIKDGTGKVVAQTRSTVPTSDEINCAKCHGADAFNDILKKHDRRHNTKLMTSKPVLCAGCHGSPALGQSGPGSSGKYLSQAIHGYHASKGASCYDCHPGNKTQCSRSLAHTNAAGNCTACHGDMSQVSSSIAAGRVPWAQEPSCAKCHGGVPEVDTGSTLYRHGKGHGGLACAACHGSPHAMVPTNQPTDNYQAIQYQGKAVALGSCAACHESNKGEGFREFAKEHASGQKASACAICHTGFKDPQQAKFPHGFLWKTRSSTGGGSGGSDD